MTTALALAACGGGGESDEDEIAAAVEAMFASTDPEDCSNLATLAFLEQSAKATGDAAIEKCEEQVNDPGRHEEAVVGEVDVDGSTATADTEFVSGDLEGQTLTIGMVEEDGDWKLNQIQGFVEFDRTKMIDSFGEALLEDDSVTEAQAECIVERLEGAGDEEIQGLILESTLDYLVPLVQSCA